MASVSSEGLAHDEPRQGNDVLALRLADLEASEERLRVLVEHAPDAYLLFDASGILDCNPAAIAMLRCEDKRQVLSLHPAVLSPELQPDGRRSLEKSVEMDRKAREHGFHRFRWVHRRMTGEDFPVEVTLKPVQLRGGPALVVTWRDLSEQHAREEAIRRQDEVIRRLSTPIIGVAAGVLLLPIVGPFDGRRADDTTSTLLAAIAAQRARVVIIDLTGVDDFEATTAGALVRLSVGAGLLGADAVLTGIRPAVAQVIVNLGVDLRGLRTAATVGEALARALAR